MNTGNWWLKQAGEMKMASASEGNQMFKLARDTDDHNNPITETLKEEAGVPINKRLYILYEHALGYALFKAKAKTVEDLKQLSDEYMNNATEFVKKFKMDAFVPFASSASALQNCNGISEGVVPDELKAFLEEKLPLDQEIHLCVAERKLAEALKAPETGLPESLNCSSESILHEVYRALRLNFPKYITEFSHFDESKAQIGLGHSYSRAKVKFNINRNDNMIIQSINLLDQLDKDVNNFCMRVKEWFSYHFPELVKIVPDNPTFVKVVGLIGTREGATEDRLTELQELTGDEVGTSIIEAAKSSVGFDITPDDAEHLAAFTQRIVALIERRKLTQEYLANKLTGVAPNLSTLIGERVSARLIAHAGSLMNLAKFPASTIQILGAEKALFRALRSRGCTPKYGLIYHSPFITRAARENKGRISRFLAAKCAIASRIDCFSEMLCDIYGKHLKKQIEDRLTYFETGNVPPTNAEAMASAIAEVNKYITKMKKKAIKTLNRKSPDPEIGGLQNGEVEQSQKKKKKKKKLQQALENHEPVENLEEVQVEDLNTVEDVETTIKKKKKKKRHNSESAMLFELNSTELTPSRKRTASESSADAVVSKKKKKNQDFI